MKLNDLVHSLKGVLGTLHSCADVVECCESREVALKVCKMVHETATEAVRQLEQISALVSKDEALNDSTGSVVSN